MVFLDFIRNENYYNDNNNLKAIKRNNKLIKENGFAWELMGFFTEQFTWGSIARQSSESIPLP